VYVIDASIALKWIVSESDSDAADALADQSRQAMIRLLALDLLLYELANILIRKFHASSTAAKKGIETVLDTGIELRSPGFPLVCRCIEIAEAQGLSGYDAAYAALAADTGATLVTADRKLAAAAKPERFKTISLADF